MQTDALGRAVIDGHEHAGRSLAPGHRGRHVGAPHDVRRLGGDRAVVRLRAMRLAHAVRGLEVVLAHQSAYSLLYDRFYLENVQLYLGVALGPLVVLLVMGRLARLDVQRIQKV